VTLTVVQITQGVTLLADPLPEAVVGRPYCDPEPVALRAVGEFPPFVFSAAFPPPGLAVEPDGRLCGTPTRVGTSTFTVNVRDALGLVDDGVFQLRVRNDDSVRIVTERLPAARVRRFYEAELRAEGGAPPYRFDVSVGALPPGFGIEPGGRIAGTSTTTGRYRFAVRATDTRGASRQAGFEIVVVPEEDGGCDCRTARAEPWLPGLALLLLAAWGRRRRTR
jgi:MYXO-CTERM domain-containing protein